MTYKDPEKRKQQNRESVRRYAERQRAKKGLPKKERQARSVVLDKKAAQAGYTKKYLAAAMIKIQQIKIEAGCIDCGYREDHTFLDFDHVRGIKRDCVSTLASKGAAWALVLEEIAKCEVRCKRCHKIRHYNNGWYSVVSRGEGVAMSFI